MARKIITPPPSSVTSFYGAEGGDSLKLEYGKSGGSSFPYQVKFQGQSGNTSFCSLNSAKNAVVVHVGGTYIIDYRCELGSLAKSISFFYPAFVSINVGSSHVEYRGCVSIGGNGTHDGSAQIIQTANYLINISSNTNVTVKLGLMHAGQTITGKLTTQRLTLTRVGS